MAQNLNAEAVAHALGSAKRTPSGFICCCPAHDDQKPSLLIWDRPEGGIGAKCLADCAFQNVREALKAKGLWPETGKRPSPEKSYARKAQKRNRDDLRVLAPVPSDAPEPDCGKLFGWEPSTYYIYRNNNGAPLMYVARLDRLDGGKEIRPLVFVQDGNGSQFWTSMAFPSPRPLYGLDHLSENRDRAILIVEGEKAAEAARRKVDGYVTVTWSGGAAATRLTDWTPLAGRHVVLWPDHDQPGLKAMVELAELLKPVVASARTVSLPESLPQKWDLADPIPADIDVAALLESAEAAQTGLRKHILSAKELLALPIPPQEYLVREWLPKGALAMIWAARGLGKTWFALTLAIAIASGKDFLGYSVPREEIVLFVDGEMAIGELQERIRRLAQSPPTNLHILPSERLFAAGAPLNINDPADQQKVLDAIEELSREGVRPTLIILDNLSSLTAGIDENDNSALDGIIRWMLKMRHAGVTVVFVHHANKSGDQRGASRREDQLNTSIRLAAPDDKGGLAQPHDGAHFVMDFTKVRGRKPKPMSMVLKLVEMPDGRMQWSISAESRIMPRDQILRFIATRAPRTQDEIATEIKRAKGTVSKDCQALEREGLIERNPPRLTEKGRQRALELWPELFSTVCEQDDLPI